VVYFFAYLADGVLDGGWCGVDGDEMQIWVVPAYAQAVTWVPCGNE